MTYVWLLVITIIVRLDGGGFTEIRQYPTLEACTARQAIVDRELAKRAKRITVYSTQCLKAPEVKPRRVPNIKMPPPLPPEINKPLVEKPTVKLTQRPTKRIKTKSVKAAKCLHRRYRIVNHQRRWYCARYK